MPVPPGVGGGSNPYELRIDTGALRALIARTRGPFGGPEVQRALGEGIRKWGALVQARAVRNVTGFPVVYEGGVFRVMVRTGTLRGAIELQWPYEGPYTARVYVNGAHMNPGGQPGIYTRPVPVSEYAAAIEFGHGEIDLKKTMKGKTVPFFAARSARARGPYAATGLKPVIAGQEDYGSRWRSETHDRKLQARGKGPMAFEKKGGNAAYTGAKRGASTYFIAFRKVGNEGWIIPEAKPRPFMRAALEGTADTGRRMLVNDLAQVLDPRRR
jgi:hypothetical protein